MAEAVQTIIHRHMDGQGSMTFETVQDCTAIAERCKEMAAIGATGTSELKYAGSIPEVFVVKYLNDNGIDFREFMTNKQHIRRMMNDPALAHFRIWKGKI